MLIIGLVYQQNDNTKKLDDIFFGNKAHLKKFDKKNNSGIWILHLKEKRKYTVYSFLKILY